MRDQRGASLLFLMLAVALAVLVATWFALPWISASRQARIEQDLVRGVAPAATPVASNAAAQERARIAEFAEAHGGFASIAATDAYRALGAPCRALIDTYVALLDKPADASADLPALRASVADIERRFDKECADAEAATGVGASAGTRAEMQRLGSNLDAYRSLGPECRNHVDVYVGLSGRPGLTPSDRDRIEEAERLFAAQCVDRTAAPTARAERQAAPADQEREAACARKREEADALRAVVDLTLGEEPPAPGANDEDRRQRRQSLESNQSRLQALDAEIASGCP